MNKAQKLFSQIYDNHIDRIYRFIFFKVNSREIAEDLCSETFLRCWEKFKNNHQEIENPPAFLYRIARNLVTDHYREKAKAQFVSIDCAPIIDPRNDLEEKVLLNSDLETIKANLAGLKDEYQEVIIWRYIDDLPISEIAKILDKSEGAVRVTLHRALNNLRNRISDSSLQLDCNKIPRNSS
ncbi:MAG: RNA polymerase sigma factor [Candidatus Nealsonbacteria bacterium]|nr:RNA polymerase sigma factor [Candidatus Nealsonbacteria bacterium]